MFSSFKTTVIVAAVLSAIAGSAVPIRRQGNPDGTMFPVDTTRNECNIQAGPNTQTVLLSNKFDGLNPAVGAAANGVCGIRGFIRLELGNSFKLNNEVVVVGLCNTCGPNDFQASEAIFKGFGLDPKKAANPVAINF